MSVAIIHERPICIGCKKPFGKDRKKKDCNGNLRQTYSQRCNRSHCKYFDVYQYANKLGACLFTKEMKLIRDKKKEEDNE